MAYACEFVSAPPRVKATNSTVENRADPETDTETATTENPENFTVSMTRELPLND
jgi:hypothetical protein